MKRCNREVPLVCFHVWQAPCLLTSSGIGFRHIYVSCDAFVGGKHGKKSCIKAACDKPSCQSTVKLLCILDIGRKTDMDKNTVTRTFSIGAICSETRDSNDFSTARRHSSAGMRALLRATSSAISFRCSLTSDTQTSRENIFPNILTPDSIPQFTIPSLSVDNGLRLVDGKTKKEDAESKEDLGSSDQEQVQSESVSRACSKSSTSSSGPSLVLSDRKAERSVSDPSTYRRSHLLKDSYYPCSYTESQHCLDPGSRAALSLPHLTKVTTPYGFLTLSQSPQMASEEALLCQAGLRRLNKVAETSCCSNQYPGTWRGDMKGKSSHLSDAKRRPSKDSRGSENNEISTSDTVYPSSRRTNSKIKLRFYEVMRKHFTSCN